MFKNNECVGSMVSGAVIGVAVGMLVERVLSPRSVQQPVNKGPNQPVCCENVKKCSDKLQVLSDNLKHHGHCHHRRSKSASRPRIVEKSCRHLSVSPALHRHTKTSVSEMDLRSRSAEKSCSRRKSGRKVNMKSQEDYFETSTEYPPFRPKVHKNLLCKMDGGLDRIHYNLGKNVVATASTEYTTFMLKNKLQRAEPALLVSEVDNRRADSIPPVHGHTDAGCDLRNKVFHSESHLETIGCESTEYLMIRELKNLTEHTKPALTLCIAGSESSDTEPANCSINATCDTIDKEIDFVSDCDSDTESTNRSSLAVTETANCSINATCDKFDKDMNFDLYSENRAETIEKLDGLSKQLVDLPTFNESGNTASVGSTKNKTANF